MKATNAMKDDARDFPSAARQRAITELAALRDELRSWSEIGPTRMPELEQAADQLAFAIHGITKAQDANRT